MTKKLLLFLNVIFLNFLLGGCGSVPMPKITKYSIDTPGAPAKISKKINVVVRRVRGRSLYEKRNIVVSPEKHIIDAYSSAQWAETPCNMLSDTIIAYLSKKFPYVTSSLQNGNAEIDLIISAYIDKFEQIKREGKWYADLSLHYEIISADTKKIIYNKWFNKKVELENSDVQNYVAAQNKSIEEFLKELSVKLTECGVR